MVAFWKESYDKPRHVLKSKDIILLTKGLYSQGCGFPSGNIWLWELYCKKGRMPKNWCLWTVVLEKTYESLLDSKEIKPVSLEKSTLNIHWKDLCWSLSSSILVIWREQTIDWKSPWYWDRLRAEVQKGVRGRDGWMASPVQWTWTWANPGR